MLAYWENKLHHANLRATSDGTGAGPSAGRSLGVYELGSTAHHADSEKKERPGGYLLYGSEKLSIDDRTLAHLQLTIVAKLRKSESFLLSGTIDPAHGSGRYAAWIDCGVPIFFRFEGSRPIVINRAWLEAMMDRSYTLAGLEVMPESEHPDTSLDA